MKKRRSRIDCILSNLIPGKFCSSNEEVSSCFCLSEESWEQITECKETKGVRKWMRHLFGQYASKLLYATWSLFTRCPRLWYSARGLLLLMDASWHELLDTLETIWDSPYTLPSSHFGHGIYDWQLREELGDRVSTVKVLNPSGQKSTETPSVDKQLSVRWTNMTLSGTKIAIGQPFTSCGGIHSLPCHPLKGVSLSQRQVYSPSFCLMLEVLFGLAKCIGLPRILASRFLEIPDVTPNGHLSISVNLAAIWQHTWDASGVNTIPGCTRSRCQRPAEGEL